MPRMTRIKLDKSEVKAIRERLAVSQNDLANMINVVPECVRRWETGRGTCGGPAAILLRRLVEEKACKNGHRRRSK